MAGSSGPACLLTVASCRMTGTPGTTAATCPHAISCRKHKPRSLPSQPRLTPITSRWMTRPSLCRGKHNFLGYPTQPCSLSWKGTRNHRTPTVYPTQDYECVIRVNYPVPHAAAPAVHHSLDTPSSIAGIHVMVKPTDNLSPHPWCSITLICLEGVNMTDEGLTPPIPLNPVGYIINLLQNGERSCPWTCQFRACSFPAWWIVIPNLCPRLVTYFLGHPVVILFLLVLSTPAQTPPTVKP